jgi:hypothetical protein
VAACMADALGRVRVPPSRDGGSRTVSFPLWISPPK